jgi:mono/diheme cytochrome c family protein
MRESRREPGTELKLVSTGAPRRAACRGGRAPFLAALAAAGLLLSLPLVPGCGAIERAFEANEPGPPASSAPPAAAEPEPEAEGAEKLTGEARVNAFIDRRVERLSARTRARRLYREACAVCHGLRGDGNGVAARALDPAPTDLTLGLYQHADGEGEELDRGLLAAISDGVPGTTMPAWKALLSVAEREELVQYVRALGGEADDRGE